MNGKGSVATTPPVRALLAAVLVMGAALSGGCNDPDVWGRTWPCATDDDCTPGWACEPEQRICVPLHALGDGTVAGDDAGDGPGNAINPPGADGGDAGPPADEDVRSPGPDPALDAADGGAGPDGGRGGDACACSEGPCCDGCRLLSASHPCETVSEYGCPDGAGCGRRVGVRTAERRCDGRSAGCDGPPGAWSAWTTVLTCAGEDACDAAAGECRPSGPCACAATCDDGDPCTVERCLPTGDCERDPLDCDDEDPCTVDTCAAGSGCVHAAAPCDDGDPCTTDTCAQGGCRHAAATDGAPCTAPGEPPAPGRCHAGSCCVPACAGRVCGADACGGTCGACDGAETCDGGTCGAVPGCGDGTCDPGGGESCRTCPDDCETEGSGPEDCDGVDDDCDGDTDDDLPADRPCARTVEGVGTCAGREVCHGAAGWTCDAPLPAVEDCDGVDDDCDGETDEGLDDVGAAACRTAGPCAMGVRAPCTVGVWRCDYAAVEGWEPTEASCDGVDNDCDGATDETLADVVAAGCAVTGVCGAGGVAAACAGGEWLCAYDAVEGWEPVEASCDARDNDCDGQTDEDLADVVAAGCRAGGVCAAGGVAAACAGGEWGCDYAGVEGWEIAETRCDGADNDCDGETDEALTAETATTDCAARGVCAGGVPAACALGAWDCDYAAVPWYEAAETSCDGRDNDCDGATDEDACAGAGEPCLTDQDCGGLPCRPDVDGVGRFCAVSATHCVVARQAATAAPIADGDVYCVSSTIWRRCNAGIFGAAAVCDDGDPCTTDACSTGPGCEASPAPDGTACDDAEACTRVDECRDGVCVGTAPDPCDDGVACTTDACPFGGAGCTHTASDAACDDGVPCTTDACDPVAGCGHTPADAACDDGVGCTADTCDPTEGCRNEPDAGACDDAVACTLDACDPAAGCQHAPSAAACDDGVVCTLDTCDPVQGCGHAADDGACPAVGCAVSRCDPTAGCVAAAGSCDCLALGFRGHERARAADAPALGGGQGASRTFEAWFRLDALREDHWGSPILSKLQSETSGDWALLAIGADLVFRFFPVGSATPVEVRAADRLVPGVWTHAAVVFDRGASKIRLLVDGALALQSSNGQNMADTAAALSVGPTPALPFGSFEGAIDEVRVWTLARASADVARDRGLALTGAEPGLAAYWTFADAQDGVDLASANLVAGGGDLAYEAGASVPAALPLDSAACALGAPARPFFSQRTLASGARGASLELFHAGAAPVPLGDYTLLVYPVWTGAPAAPTELPLPAVSLEPHTAFVVCGGSNVTGCDALTGLAFAANQALVLRHDPTGAVADSFGRAGENPGTHWGATVPSNASVLLRTCAATAGDEDPQDPFDPAEEWVRPASPDVLGDRRLHCGLAGGVRCPTLSGHTLRGNEKHHCEYVPAVPVASDTSYGPVIWVPPSAFPMGSPEGEGPAAERPQHEVSFARGYYIDRYEVTQAAYAVCGAAGCAPPECEMNPGAWDPAGTPDHPVVCIDWDAAAAFCAWHGMRLPTEAEWERAAKGTTHRQYPWGEDPPDATTTNIWGDDEYLYAAPVGSFPAGASPVGALDMAGNVFELVEDDWHASYLGAPSGGSAWTDAPRGTTRVGRGCCWGCATGRASLRVDWAAGFSQEIAGMRCARE